MKAIRIYKAVEKDGELYLENLPCKKGQRVEAILLIEPALIPDPAHTEEDPVLKLRGLGKEIWAGVNPDQYVQELREGWE